MSDLLPLYCPKCGGVFESLIPVLPIHIIASLPCEGSGTLAALKIKACPHVEDPNHKHDDCPFCKGYVRTPIRFNTFEVLDTETGTQWNSVSLIDFREFLENHNYKDIVEIIAAVWGGEVITIDGFTFRDSRYVSEPAKE